MRGGAGGIDREDALTACDGRFTGERAVTVAL